MVFLSSQVAIYFFLIWGRPRWFHYSWALKDKQALRDVQAPNDVNESSGMSKPSEVSQPPTTHWQRLGIGIWGAITDPHSLWRMWCWRLLELWLKLAADYLVIASSHFEKPQRFLLTERLSTFFTLAALTSLRASIRHVWGLRHIQWLLSGERSTRILAVIFSSPIMLIQSMSIATMRTPMRQFPQEDGG